MGKQHLLELYLTVPHEHIHTLSRVLISFLDITERRQAETEHQQLEHQFNQAQKLESLGVLAGGIAHDFNNILTVILGHCYMAKEYLDSEEKYIAAFLKVETAANRAADLCRQMLSYAGKSPMEQTRVNLWLLVDEVVKMLQAAIKKNVAIELDLNCVVPEIKGDAGQIQQIIMNLIINAAEAIADNNGAIRVALTRILVTVDQRETDAFGTYIQPGAYICLDVTDTGCGMDEETQTRIFEPFYTTKLSGRGLGMSAIHGIIKSHRGMLQLTSKPGVGTTFKVFFPVPLSSDHSETASPASIPNEETNGTILLVEDEELLRVMGETLLEAMGFVSLTASNGSEALEIYRERGSEIDVILLDLIMPVLGGIETYHELRKISPAVPIIICSGYGVESVVDALENDPNAGFVHKPYKPEELRGLMVRMMGGTQTT
jgi:signal transduction histidine kinase/CheY-like chemotaxis protein